uniref:Uncharacterized protein n=1 Tax=Dulem virus 40 TaxID=3145758 RepID=A0AAU8AUT6_9CAUD
MTPIEISLIVMTAAAIGGICASCRNFQRLQKLSDTIEENKRQLDEIRSDAEQWKDTTVAIMDALATEAYVMEDCGNHCFMVTFDTGDGSVSPFCYSYDPNDPDDRKYKLLHAQEVADKLNEKP